MDPWQWSAIRNPSAVLTTSMSGVITAPVMPSEFGFIPPHWHTPFRKRTRGRSSADAVRQRRLTGETPTWQARAAKEALSLHEGGLPARLPGRAGQVLPGLGPCCLALLPDSGTL